MTRRCSGLISGTTMARRASSGGRSYWRPRAPAAGISLLQGLNFLLLHVHRGEYEVHLGGNPVDVCFRVEHHHVLGLPGHGDIQGPAATNGLLVGLARRAAAGRDGGQLKPGVVLQKGNEALTDHAGAADDANSVLFHNQYLRRSIISYSRSSLFETGKMRTSYKRNQQFTCPLILYYNVKDDAATAQSNLGAGRSLSF